MIEVTNLKDDGPGSLREAIQHRGPRIIVFKVSGVIRLQSPLTIRDPYLMIAGQTAPGDGICIAGSTFKVQTHDVVIRFLRFRPGIEQTTDAMAVSLKSGPAPHNVVIDHCSFSWATDENASIWFGANNITFQWCIFSEGLHVKNHSKGFLIGRKSYNISAHHNLFAHNVDRNPAIQNVQDMDFVNNVIYNWGGRCMKLIDHKDGEGRPIEVNFVGNYIKAGPSMKDSPISKWELTMSSGINAPMPAGSKLYLSGNIGSLHRPTDKGDDWLITPISRSYMTDRRHQNPLLTEWDVVTSYEKVLSHAGCALPTRDAVDSRIVSDVRQGTGKIINMPADVGGYPVYRTASPVIDSDGDGMSDVWEMDNGLDPKDSSDGTRDRNGDGYTNVEEYLNSLVPGSVYGRYNDPQPKEEEPNKSPYVIIRSPEAGSVHLLGEAIRFEVEANDVDGKVVRVGLLVNGEEIVTDNDYPYVLEWIPTGQVRYTDNGRGR